MIHRFDRLMFLFKDMDGNMMNLNGEFELQLTIEDVIEQGVAGQVAMTNQFSMIEVFGNNSKNEVKLDNPLSFNQCYISSVSLYTDFVLHNVPTDQVVVINGGRTDASEITIPQGAYELEQLIAMLNACDALFEVVYSGANAFRVSVNGFETIDFTNAPEVQNILGFESSILEKGLDNPKRYYLSTTCNQIVVTNGSMSHVLSIPSGYYTFTEFIESVSVELNKHVSTPSITLHTEYAQFNTIDEEWYFDRSSPNTTINGFGWTPWFKLSPTTHNLCIERPVEGVFDINGGGEPDKTDDQGLGGYAYLEPTYVEYDWQLSTSDYRFIDKPLVTYVMTNSDGSTFDSGSFYVTEDTMTSITMNSLMTTCFNELNARYDEIRGIPPSHEEAIAWEVNSNEYSMSWSANTYAPDLELSITSNNTSELMSMNDDSRSGSIGPWYACDCIYHGEVFIDTTTFVLGIKDYDETSITIPRGEYTAEEIVQSLADVINEICVSHSIGVYLVYVRIDSGGEITMGCRNVNVPRFILRCDNPFISITPGPYTEGDVYLSCSFSFHRNWYVKMPELTTPISFIQAVHDGVLKPELKYRYTNSPRRKNVYVNQPMRIEFATQPMFNSNDFNGFIDWPDSNEYKTIHVIYLPYHTMFMNQPYVTYSDDTQTVQLSIRDRVTQSELLMFMNEEFTANNIDVKWVAGADGYYINADHVFTLTGEMGTTIPVSGSLSHTWKMPYNDGAYYSNFGPMVAEYPVDITNGLSNIRLYCNIVKSKTNPLLVNIPMDSLYKNYFYKNRMLIPCSELLDRIEYELKDENDESLSFVGNVYLLIGFTVIAK